jgi:hypothetical protein
MSAMFLLGKIEERPQVVPVEVIRLVVEAAVAVEVGSFRGLALKTSHFLDLPYQSNIPEEISEASSWDCQQLLREWPGEKCLKVQMTKKEVLFSLVRYYRHGHI